MTSSRAEVIIEEGSLDSMEEDSTSDGTSDTDDFRTRLLVVKVVGEVKVLATFLGEQEE
jgi:hypothetical protein